MSKKNSSFEDLIVWQRAQQLAKRIYQLSEENPFVRKDFSIRDKLKRASLSVSDNNADFFRYLRIEKGSCGEVRNKLFFIQSVGMADNSILNTICHDTLELGNQIGALMRKVREKTKKP